MALEETNDFIERSVTEFSVTTAAREEVAHQFMADKRRAAMVLQDQRKAEHTACREMEEEKGAQRHFERQTATNDGEAGPSGHLPYFLPKMAL